MQSQTFRKPIQVSVNVNTLLLILAVLYSSKNLHMYSKPDNYLPFAQNSLSTQVMKHLFLLTLLSALCGTLGFFWERSSCSNDRQVNTYTMLWFLVESFSKVPQCPEKRLSWMFPWIYWDSKNCVHIQRSVHQLWPRPTLHTARRWGKSQQGVILLEITQGELDAESGNV